MMPWEQQCLMLWNGNVFCILTDVSELPATPQSNNTVEMSFMMVGLEQFLDYEFIFLACKVFSQPPVFLRCNAFM